VTPRIGKPVEVNALWIQALDVAGGWRRADRGVRTLETARASFVERFVRSDGRGLLDVVDGPGRRRPALRPNQLLAVSLPAGPLAGAADGTRPAPSWAHALRS
jgi:4-alpha-glucanotransferase